MKDSSQTRQVYNGPWVAKLIAAIRKLFSVESDFEKNNKKNTNYA